MVIIFVYFLNNHKLLMSESSVIGQPYLHLLDFGDDYEVYFISLIVDFKSSSIIP